MSGIYEHVCVWLGKGLQNMKLLYGLDLLKHHFIVKEKIMINAPMTISHPVVITITILSQNLTFNDCCAT